MGGKGKYHLVRWLGHGHGFNLFILAFTVGNHLDRGVPVLHSNSKYRPVSPHHVSNPSPTVVMS